MDQPAQKKFITSCLFIEYKMSTCLNVKALNFVLFILSNDSGTKMRMNMTSANATRLAVMITMFSLSVSNSIPAPRAGDIIREAANPEIDDE